MRARPARGPMLARVLEHNRLNGYGFVAAEFGLIAALVLGISVAYGLRGRWLEAAIAAGIGINAVLVLALSSRSLLRRERGVGVLKLYGTSTARAEIAATNPRLLTDTLLIAAAVLVPFCLSALLARDALQRRHK